MTLAERIDALLPQTQCTRCGYPACLPYAEALAAGQATANLCEPGGAVLIPALAALSGQALLPPAHPLPPVEVAWVREADCIGCARCLPACPVDAILGARRFSHTVIAQDCNGCRLCLPACPVDCIEMRAPAADWSAPSADDNRRRYHAHQHRRKMRARARAGVAQPPTPPEARPGPAVPVAHPAAPPATIQQAPSMSERRAALIAQARAAAAARRGQP